MSASTANAAPKPPPTKPKKDRERKEKPPVVSERLKSVVRRLPPNLPEDIFWGSVTAWVTEETVSWKTYCPGKVKKRLNKENIPSRAYIAFKNEEQLALFGKEYDGHLFRDKAGNDYQAVVEFAPYQKIPSEKKKLDARNATIEQDEDYISFIESLKASTATEHPSLEALIAASQPPPPPKTTPLLEALKAEKTANKDKEAILRNHAHYKDHTILASLPRKDSEHGKKKGGSAQKTAEPVPGGISKKAAKKQAQAQAEAAQKAASVTTHSNKNTNQNNSAGSSNPAPPPKFSKQSRAHKAALQAQAKPPPKPPTNSVPVSPPPGTSSVPATNPGTQVNPLIAPPPATATTSVKDPPTARRSRPVIGLASRQFEAALSGAGVASASPGGDRRPRREREKESEGQAPNQPNEGSVSTAKQTPPSPRRARHTKAPPSGTGGPPPPPSVRVPGILHPPPVAPGSGDASQGIGAQSIHGSERGGGRGFRRGRGRGGRGAQGPPVRGG